MQNIGEQQFLVLLLVLKPDLDDRYQLIEILRRLDEVRCRRIDMRAIGSDLSGSRPRDQAALRARLARPGGDIIRIVEKGEALIERAIGLGVRPQQELFEEPCHMRAVPFGRARVGHRLNDLVLGRKQSRAAFRLGAHRAKGIEPVLSRISQRIPSRLPLRMARFGSIGLYGGMRRVSEPNTRGSGRMWHGGSPQRTELSQKIQWPGR